jgi:hypothetical protein
MAKFLQFGSSDRTMLEIRQNLNKIKREVEHVNLTNLFDTWARDLCLHRLLKLSNAKR